MPWSFFNSSGELQINDGGVSASAAVFTGNVDLGSNLLVGNGGSTGIAISANGEVTMAKQPSVFAYGSASDNNETGTGSTHTIIFDTEVTDQNADFDGTSTFTAPVTGVYHVALVVKLQGVTSSASNAGMAMVASNRSIDFDFGGNISSMSGAVTHGYSAWIDMDADDTLTLTIFVNGESSDVVDIDGAANPITFLCVTKVA